VPLGRLRWTGHRGPPVAGEDSHGLTDDGVLCGCRTQSAGRRRGLGRWFRGCAPGRRRGRPRLWIAPRGGPGRRSDLVGCMPSPGPGLQCARIRVPLDWDRPNGRTIRLALIRHLASKPDERIGTLFINPGGPGDTGVGLVRGDPEGVDAIGGGRFDVVSWDPRGAHASTRVRCFKNRRSEERFWAGASIPTTRAEAKRTVRKGAALARRCGKVSGCFCPTSRPPTPPATWTTCGSWWASRSSPTSASPTAPTSARPTPTCSPTGSGRCCSMASSIRSGTRRAPRRGWPCSPRSPARSLASSSRCARARDRSAARSPAARAPRPRGGSGCARG
jgi:hypothetical protein